jgi:hypothetical protein
MYEFAVIFDTDFIHVSAHDEKMPSNNDSPATPVPPPRATIGMYVSRVFYHNAISFHRAT